MQLSLEKLRALSEADLRRKVLIPLFEAMEFRDVTEIHGSRELGKDIIMWKDDPFRGRINYAAVVKAKKVTTGTLSHDVCRQVRECFGSSYTDPISLETRAVDRVIVINSDAITDEAKESIKSELKSSNLEGKTDLIEGPYLFGLVRKFLPQRVLWDPLQRASKALEEASDNWAFTLKVGPNGVSSLLVSDKHPQAQDREPIAGSMTLRFPPTPEGMQKLAEYQRYLETGTPVELSAENIETFEIPDFVRSLAPEGEITTLILGPSTLSETIIRSLLVLSESGQLLYSLEYIHLTHRQGGSREFSLDNRGQPIPFRFRLVVDKEASKFSINLNFEPKGANILQYLRWLLLAKAASEGHQVVLADWQTGLFKIVADAKSFDLGSPPDEEIEMVKRLVFIQNRTHTEISLGEGARWTTQDIENSALAFQILTQGQAQLPAMSISFSATEPSEWTGRVGEMIRLPVVKEDFDLEILGTRIPLGEAHILCRGTLQQTSSEEGEHQFKIEASQEEPFLAAFPQWLRQRSAETVSNAGPIEEHSERNND